MRKLWIFLAVTTAGLTLSAGAVFAANQYRARPLDKQNLGLIAEHHTTHTRWGALAHWGPSDSMTVMARGGIAATLSVTVSGGPVQFRMVLEDVNHDWAFLPMRPYGATFDPGTETLSYSFTFMRAVPPGPYTVNIDWRSPTGAPVTLENGSLVVQYGAA